MPKETMVMRQNPNETPRQRSGESPVTVEAADPQRVVENALKNIQQHLQTPFESLSALQQHAVMRHLDSVSAHNLQGFEDTKKGLFGRLREKIGGLFPKKYEQPHFAPDQLFNVAVANLFPQHDVIARNAEAHKKGYQLAGEPHSPEHRGSVLLQDLNAIQINFSTQEGHQILQTQKEIKNALQYFEDPQNFSNAQLVLNKKQQNQPLTQPEQVIAQYLEYQPARLAFEKIKRQKEDAETVKRAEVNQAARRREAKAQEDADLLARQQREALRPQTEQARRQELERVAIPDVNNPLAIRLDNMVNRILEGNDQWSRSFSREEIHLLFNAVNPLMGGEKPNLPASLKARIELLPPSDFRIIQEKLLNMVAKPL